MIDANKIIINGTEYLFQQSDENQNKIISFSSVAGFDWSVDECIIIPVSMQTIFEENNIFYNAMIELCIQENINVQIVDEIVECLSEKHDSYYYAAVNKIEEYKERSNDLSSTIALLSWIAKFSIILVCVGMIGVLLILLDKREKDIMISFWVGADKWKLNVELLLEMLILCFVGGGISLILGTFIAPKLSNAQYIVFMSQEAIWAILVLCLVISFTICITTMFCMNKKQKVT